MTSPATGISGLSGAVTPILPGFYPDPSICRVGEDYYLVNSTFEYFPGVPIFHSTDLVTWTQIGNVLDRPSQLPLGPDAGGIFAPTIRNHDGRFWMITTDIGRVDQGHLIVTAVDPAGPWSEPVFTTGAAGIDPDLAWDDDGVCHLTWTRLTPRGSKITGARLDPASGALLSPPVELWSGTGLSNPEGPHLIRRGDWWYLLIAEGGTERGHAVSIARSRSIDGAFEGNPANPILSHRSTSHPVQNTGHSDLVELPSGEWAMVYLGVRPRGTTPGFHVNGRETFIAGIDWIDDWPVVDESRFDVPVSDTDFSDGFGGGGRGGNVLGVSAVDVSDLDGRWISPGGPASAFASRGPAGGLALAAPTDAGAPREASARLLAVRTRDAQWAVEVVVTEGDVSLVVRLDDANFVAVDAVGDGIVARTAIGGMEISLASGVRTAGAIVLSVRALHSPEGMGFRTGPDVLHLGVVEGDAFVELASLDGRYTSTEVAGGFTGRVVGVSAGPRGGVVGRFTYRRIDGPDVLA